MGDDPSHSVLIAGRYRLGARLGVGSRGEVFRAEDLVEGAPVAVKLLDPVDADERRRVLREIAALRALRVPGVVPLLDEGRHGARHFIAMRLVDGAPFPGEGGADPAVAAERIERLLVVLDRVHRLGVVHRDLKPANVLVDRVGEVVVLDFGLARGAHLGGTITAAGATVGTPRYQPPEQMRGLAVDARADLYAVGVMAFEALTGQPPHPIDSLPVLMRSRLTADAPSLADAAPGVPAPLASLVDRLLARAPGDRPASAADALAALRGEAPPAAWPWLGSRAPIDAIIAHLEAGRPCTVGGAPRSGRHRALDEAARALAATHPVHRLGRAERPFASLVGLVDPSRLGGDDPLPDRVRLALAALLAAGAVLIVGDDIDRWTARALDGLDGAIASVVPPGCAADVELAPISAADLHPLFVGPERLFHLVSDPSRALVERAGGRRGEVVETLAAWLTDGIAERVGDRLAIDRVALQRALTRPRALTGQTEVDDALADLVVTAHLAWPHTTVDQLALALDRPRWEVELAALELVEQRVLVALPDGRLEPRAPMSALPDWSEPRRAEVHARLATALPAGADGRLRHLLAGTDAHEIATEALRLTTHGGAEGIGILREALRAVRRDLSTPETTSDAERRLLTEMVRLALSDDGQPQLRAVHAELTRVVSGPTDELGRLDRLLALGAALRGPEPGAVRAAVETMAPFADDALELARLKLLATAAIYESPASSERVLDAIEPWFAERSPATRARLAGWRGNLLYRQGHFDRAAAMHLAAAEHRPAGRGRLACLANAGFALLEAFDFDRAAAIGARLRTDAAAERLPTLEAMGERLVRAVAYRTGRAATPDDALVAAAAGLRHVTVAALIALNEGAVAWRAGQLETARHHATTAADRARRAGQRLVTRMAEALAMLAHPPSRRRVEAFAAEALAEPTADALPRISAQLLGVARRCHPDPPLAWTIAARRWAATVPTDLHRHRLELLSLDEATS